MKASIYSPGPGGCKLKIKAWAATLPVWAPVEDPSCLFLYPVASGRLWPSPWLLAYTPISVTAFMWPLYSLTSCSEATDYCIYDQWHSVWCHLNLANGIGRASASKESNIVRFWEGLNFGENFSPLETPHRKFCEQFSLVATSIED